VTSPQMASIYDINTLQRRRAEAKVRREHLASIWTCILAILFLPTAVVTSILLSWWSIPITCFHGVVALCLGAYAQPDEG
jgi:hypothetical protein